MEMSGWRSKTHWPAIKGENGLSTPLQSWHQYCSLSRCLWKAYGEIINRNTSHQISPMGWGQDPSSPEWLACQPPSCCSLCKWAAGLTAVLAGDFEIGIMLNCKTLVFLLRASIQTSAEAIDAFKPCCCCGNPAPVACSPLNLFIFLPVPVHTLKGSWQENLSIPQSLLTITFKANSHNSIFIKLIVISNCH